MARIFIVEDEETVAESVAYSLRRLGHEVVVFGDGLGASEAIAAQRPELVVLDLMLPGLDGLELCRRLRALDARLPVLMLTARSGEADRVLGLEIGADDYVVKPFSVREVEARVKALLRRSGLTSEVENDPIVMGAFSLDRRRGVFQVNGANVPLTRRQLDLLAALMLQDGGIISRDDLLRRVWGDDFAGEAKTLDVHIRWLREKIEPDPGNPRHIITLRGRGYRFDAG